MQPLSPLVLTRETEPNIELLRRAGWSVNNVTGPYCVAWRGRDEVVFQWRDGAWQGLGARGNADGF